MGHQYEVASAVYSLFYKVLNYFLLSNGKIEQGSETNSDSAYFSAYCMYTSVSHLTI